MHYLEKICEQHESVLLDFARRKGMQFFGPESTDSEPSNYMHFRSDIAGNVQRKIYLGADHEGLYAFGSLATIKTGKRGRRIVEVGRYEEKISLFRHEYSTDSENLINRDELRALLNQAYSTMMAIKPKDLTEKAA